MKHGLREDHWSKKIIGAVRLFNILMFVVKILFISNSEIKIGNEQNVSMALSLKVLSEHKAQAISKN